MNCSPAPRSISAPSTCCSSTPGSPSSLPVEQTTEALHDEILDINFKGAFFTVQKALPLLKDGGAIVINTSVVAGKAMPNGSVYAASKAALRSLTRTLAAELLGRKNSGERRRPRPDLDAHLRERRLDPPRQRRSWRTASPSDVPMKRLGDVGRGRQGR